MVETGAIPNVCDHKTWIMGCENCFNEMSSVALKQITVGREAAHIEGAILFNWHVLMMLADFHHQLVPLTQSIDLQKVTLAKDLIANIRQIEVYLINLVADEGKLINALAGAAILAKEAKAAIDAQEAVTPSILITG